MQRTAIFIYPERLKRNYQRVRKCLDPKTEVMAVVKSDAYNLGVKNVLPALKECGIQNYAVSTWQEGAALRQCGANEENILILGDILNEELGSVTDYHLTPTVFSFETAEKLNDIAKTANIIQPIHIKIDTGMNRIGFNVTQQDADVIAQISRLHNLKIAGMYTHFARAEEPDCDMTEKQTKSFQSMVTLLAEQGVEAPIIHLANSAAVMFWQDVQCSMVRVGGSLLGLCPVPREHWEAAGYEELLTWDTYVAFVKKVPSGVSVGYGDSYITKRDTIVATLPVGFADGYSRDLSNKGYVIIHGMKAPVIGTVCMNQMMVDVTNIPNVKRGDTVRLLGGEQISVLTMAEMLHTTTEDVICRISNQIPRIIK